MEVEVRVEDFEAECRRRCTLRLVFDAEAAAELLRRLGVRCRLDADEPVEVEVAVEDFDYACKRGGCIIRMELDERGAERLRARLAALC